MGWFKYWELSAHAPVQADVKAHVKSGIRRGER